MTFLSTLNRIAPVATRTASTSIKPAFSAFAQKRYNSNGVTEVSGLYNP